MKLLGYIRVSRVGAREGESFQAPEQQREAITAYAKAHGHEVKFLDPDLDETGSKLDRPSMQKALETVADGKADGIIAARLDRLTRSVGDLGTLLRTSAAEGWNLIAVDMGLDASTSNGKLVWNMLASIAEWELDRRRDGWSTSRANAIERGVHIGPAPAGYSRSKSGRLEPNEHAPAVGLAFEARAGGASWTQVKRLLEDAGVPTCYGRTQWSVGAVSKVLASEAYLGVVRSGEYRLEDAHPALVSRAVFKAVAARRETRAVTRSAKDGVPAEPRLLAGLLRCAACERRLSVDWMKRPSGEQYPFYRCRNRDCKARPTIGAVKIEQQIEQVLRERLAAGDLLIETDADEAAPLRAELAAVKADLGAWIADDSGVSHEAWKARTAVLEARVKTAQDALDAVEVAGLAEPLPSIEKYDLLPVALRREVMSAFLDAVAESGLGRLAVKRGSGDRRFVWLPETVAA